MSTKCKLIIVTLVLITTSMFYPFKDYISTVFSYEDQALKEEQSDWWKKAKALELYLEGLVVSNNFMELRFARALGLDEYTIAERYPFDEQRYNRIKNIQKMMEQTTLLQEVVIVESEKGLGDIIQFSRYVRSLNAHCKKVIFSVPPSLYELFKTSNEFSGVTLATPAMIQNTFPKNNSLENAFKIPLLAIPSLTMCKPFSYLPHVVKRDRCPYIFAPSTEKEALKLDSRFQTNTLKVGLCWQGDKNHINDKNRSVPLSIFYSLASLPNVQLYSLQFGYGSEQLQEVPSHISIIDLKDCLTSFPKTAAAIDQLDIIITIDSAIAHLCGAMNKRVWTLIPYLPDFRWFFEGTDTPWYPAMTLYRQSSPGIWSDVVEKIENNLRNIESKN